MLIQADPEGRKFIESIINAGMKAGAFCEKDIVSLAIGIQTVKPIEEKKDD